MNFDFDDTFATFFGESATCKVCGKTILSDTMEEQCTCEFTPEKDEEFERKQETLRRFESDDSGHN